MQNTIDPVQAAEDAANRLLGSCLSLHDLGSEYEELENNEAFCARLDELVFCCEGCAWWFEASDNKGTDELMCEDCCEDSTE